MTNESIVPSPNSASPETPSQPSKVTVKVERFSVVVRLEHAAVMLLFLLLLATGLPQKWPYVEISRFMIDFFGGIYATRYLHRIAGVLFSLLAVAHMSRVAWGLLRRRLAPVMFIKAKDFQDAISSLRYYLGKSDTGPRFGRYDYRQKFEYWGMLFGSVVMVVTGFVLLFPITLSRLLPAELIPASKVMHSNEAMLALLIVIVWHMYNAHFDPDIFPYDSSIFTGKISKDKLAHHHPLEYEELFAAESKKDEEDAEARE